MKQEIEWKPTEKQEIAFHYLTDKKTTELLFGGAAGGGKTYLGCVWIAFSCLKYPGSRWCIGRSTLTQLKASTLLTFFDVLKHWGLRADKDYNYNQSSSTVTFFNESVVYLRELKLDPSDPEFDKLGSTEFTGAFIDECSQVSTKGKNILTSRVRYRLDEFGLVPKTLLCSNPTKNFLYYEFFKPWQNKELPEYRRYIPAFVTDNPFISKYYVENLKKLDKVSKERLLYGNWSYDDDPARLFEYDNIVNMFTNEYVLNEKDLRYLSVDAARFGTDKTVFFLWKGFFVEHAWVYDKTSIDFIQDRITELCKTYQIPRSRVVVDEDGIGGGVVDNLKGIKGFVNNSRAYKRDKLKSKDTVVHNYGNLKAQCYFALSQKVNADLIGVFKGVPVEVKDRLIEDLEQVKWHNPDKDSRLFVTPKELIKENIGRSPDYGDALMMRLFFEVATPSRLSFGMLDVMPAGDKT